MSIGTNFTRQNKMPDLNKLPVRLHQKLQKRSGGGNKAFFLPIEQFYIPDVRDFDNINQLVSKLI